MSSASSTTISGFSAGHGRRITGIPGLAVRVGRLLELWGTRAARPVLRSEIEVRRQAEWHAQIALAARSAEVTRGTYQPIR